MMIDSLPITSSPSFGGRGLKVRVVRLDFALTLALSREREREIKEAWGRTLEFFKKQLQG